MFKQERKVRYKPQAFSAYRTPEQQALLLAKRAKRAWNQWCRRDENGKTIGVAGQDEQLDDAMRALYQQVCETDVFYSGYQIGIEETG